MTCGLCGFTFDAEQAARACQGCPISGCRLVRCPRCGYEMPPEPKWLARLMRRKETHGAERSG